ncbi:hypothetical protein Hanom_Chr04g00313501 [Helianthus anomalus]
MPHLPICPKDTLWDIYYKTYTEEDRGDAPHHPPWGLKQKDTFLEFAPCRDWFLNSFPPGELNRQRARTHDGLYHAYIVGEANTRVANHQIVREWHTMVKDFEKMKSSFAEEKAQFESERKSEEWGREVLRSKLRAAEELLSKERAEWKEITDLEAHIATLTKKVEDVGADRASELKAQVASKDKYLKAKDVEIAELKRRLHEQTDKNESLEIDLEAERVKAATAEEAKQRVVEARDISTSALNVAQNNYAEAQGIVDTLGSWMCSRGLDATVATHKDASRAVGHRGGYLECAQHIEEAFEQEFDVSHCSVTDQADVALARAEGVYNHLSLPVMDLVTEALKHDDWCSRLKTILLSDEEETTGGDGDGDGDGEGGGDEELVFVVLCLVIYFLKFDCIIIARECFC